MANDESNTSSAPNQADSTEAEARIARNQAALAAFETTPTFGTFQAAVATTAIYPGAGECPAYALLGLVDESCEAVDAAVKDIYKDKGSEVTPLELVLGMLARAGKVAGAIKKIHRDKGGVINQEDYDTLHGYLVTIDSWTSLLRDTLNDYRIEKRPLGFEQAQLSDAGKAAVAAETSDAFWYLSQSATECNASLATVAAHVVFKLASRLRRGKIGGSGDNR